MRDWAAGLFLSGHGVGNAIVVITVVAVLGLALGETRLGPVRLGIAGPLFVGLALGHLGLRVDAEIRDFAQNFGLILFVYAIGITVGPGFFQAFRREGALLNGLAAAIVALGALIAVGLYKFGGLPLEVVVGLFSGGTTNTPSLAAGTQMLATLHANAAQLMAPGLGYAVAYPFGVVGILITMGLVRRACRVDLASEAKAWAQARHQATPPLTTMSIEVRNASRAGPLVRDVSGPSELGTVISRILHDGQQRIAMPDDVLVRGDVVLAVGPLERLRALCDELGKEAQARLQPMESPLKSLRMVVTRRQALGRSIADLQLRSDHGVTVTRLIRAGVELVPDGEARLSFGDYVQCVGEAANLKAVARLLGNETTALQFPQIIPIFLGLALGVLVGSIPLYVPGVPAPITLGLAGGPVVVAIALSRLGSIGPLVWHVPPGVAHTLREIGVTIFMACVGVNAGRSFVATLLNGDGALWLVCGAGLTLLPILLVGLVGRVMFRLNFLTLCGVLAGSMTDPPALAFANALVPSQAQATAYAAVYPLTMCLRILTPQIILALLWASGG
jgi:putative transport protein